MIREQASENNWGNVAFQIYKNHRSADVRVAHPAREKYAGYVC